MPTKYLIVLSLWLTMSLPIFAAIPFFNFSKYQELSKRVVKHHKLNPDTHTALSRNLAYYLRNYLTLQELSKLKELKTENALEELLQRNFWADKLERDISIPYSDSELHEYLSSLQSELDQFYKYIQFINVDGSEIKLSLFGSFAKGRFGANSSIDIYIESPDHGLLNRIDQGIYSKFHPNFRGNVEVTTELFGAGYLLEPMQDLQISEILEIKKAYARILNEFGFTHGKNHRITSKGKVQKHTLEFNPVEDRLYYLIKKSRRLSKDIARQFGVFAIGASNPQVQKRRAFTDSLSAMHEDFTEVEEDLLLIINNRSSKRLDKIKSVIEGPSLQRMQGFRSKRLLKSVRSWLVRLESMGNLLN